jgi:hypothetical protein
MLPAASVHGATQASAPAPRSSERAEATALSGFALVAGQLARRCCAYALRALPRPSRPALASMGRSRAPSQCSGTPCSGSCRI